MRSVVVPAQVSSSQLLPNSTLQLIFPTVLLLSFPSATAVPASFNWLIFWQRAGQIGAAGSISHAHQHPQEALSTLYVCVYICSSVCVCVYSVMEMVPAKWVIGVM